MKIAIRFGTCLALSTLAACGSNVSRPQFISDTGVTKEVVDAAGISPLNGGLLYHFKLAEEAARPYDRQSGRLVLAKSDPEKQRQFMEAGFALIQARCNKYILAKSDNQRRVNVWRDTFAPITALLTGAVTLIGNGENTDNDALTALSLGTTAASAGFRIYEQRYLFGAENVNSVRLLIQAALADNAAVAMNTDPKTRTYAQSVTHLINNQAVCSPGHILQLVSAAIKTGKVESKVDGEKPSASTDSKGEKVDKADGETKAKAALLDQLKKDKAVTDAQIAAAQAKIAAAPIAPPPPVAIPDGQVPASTQTPTLKIVTTGIRNE